MRPSSAADEVPLSRTGTAIRHAAARLLAAALFHATARLLAAVTLLIATLGGAAARPALAQEPEPQPDVGRFIEGEAPGEPARGYVTGFGGFLTPLGDLTADPASFGTALTVSGIVGGEVTVWVGRHWGFGLQGAYAPGDLEVRPTEFQGAIPGELGGVDYLVGTLGVLYRLPVAGPASLLEPYFAAGGGVRYLGVEPIAEPEVSDVTGAVATVAGGAYAHLSSRFSLRFEARDLVSVFESPTTGDSRLQNDITVTVGLATALR